MSHQVELSGDETVVMIWLDPEYLSDRSLSESGRIVFPLPDLAAGLSPFLERPLDCSSAAQIRNRIMGWTSGNAKELDDRVVEAIAWIKSHLTLQTITAEQLATEIYLSPSRLMHLFSEQVGIPVRKFILWQRLKYALLMLADGSAITKAAHAAGFTDSAHMNRTFNAMFGIGPSEVFKNSRFIQFIAC